MIVLHTVVELRAAVAQARREGKTVGLVPTMGALHAGHTSLLRRARHERDFVVMSLFVNPAQFDEAADLDAYPRTGEADSLLASSEGVDVLFAPDPDEMYPPGFATTVSVGGLTEVLEGEQRGRSHFDGVTTVVLKLLNMAVPDTAYFGQKDAQQAVVIARMVRDLDVPVAIAVVPTVREDDGLALSSRNAHLDGPDRERAVALSRGLRAAEQCVAAGERDGATVTSHALAAMHAFDVEPEYLALVDPETLAPVAHVEEEALLAVAARFGTTRLIDNTLLHADGRSETR
jgi:pantoate--beta-alanine ligase